MKAEEAKAGVIDRVAAIARDRARPEQADDLESFVRRYYVNAPPDDLTEVDPVDLYGAAIAHWSLAARRNPRGRTSASTTHSSTATAGRPRTPWSRRSPTTCPSWSTRCAWR